MIKAKLLGKKTLIFGLSWNQTSKESLQSDIKLESDRIAMDYSVFRRYETPEDKIVYQFALSDYEESSGALSAADVLSSLQEDLVFIYSINDSECWICVIHDGVIVSGGDVVIKKESFYDSYQKLLTDLELDLSQFRIYADTNAIDFADGIYEAEIDFEEVLDQVDFSDFQVFAKIRKNIQKYILAGVGIAILGLGIYVASSFKEDEVVMQQQPRPSIENMRLKMPEERQRNVGDIVNQRVGPSRSQIMEDAYREEISWLNFDYNLNDESKLLNEIASFLRKQNINEGGWVARNYYYDISAPRFHEIVWSKRHYGTALTLRRSLENKGVHQLQFNDNGTRVSSFMRASDTRPDRNVDVLRVMSSSERDLFYFMHDLDTNNFSWSSESTPVSERPVAIAGISNMMQARTRQLKMQSRNFRISGIGISEIEKLSILLESHDRFLIQRLSFDFNQNFNWIIYGVFYEQEIR